MKWDPCGIIADLSGFAADSMQDPTDIENEILRPIRQIISESPFTPEPMLDLKLEYWADHFRSRFRNLYLPSVNQETSQFLSDLIQIQNLYLTLQILRSNEADFESQILTARSALGSDNLAVARISRSLKTYNTISSHFISKALQQISLISGTVVNPRAKEALAWANQYSGPKNEAAIEAFEGTSDLRHLNEIKINISSLSIRLDPAIDAVKSNFWKRVRSLSSPNSRP